MDILANIYHKGKPMPLSPIKATKAFKNSLYILAAFPLVVLALIGVVFYVEAPERGLIPWLQTVYGISHQAYAGLFLVIVAVYAVGLYRFLWRQRSDAIAAALTASGSIPLCTHTYLVWYYNAYVNPGGSNASLVAWAALAVIIFLITYHLVSTEEWVERARHNHELG